MGKNSKHVTPNVACDAASDTRLPFGLLIGQNDVLYYDVT